MKKEEELLKLTKRQLELETGLTRITSENSRQFIGFNIIFYTRDGNVIRKINKVSDSGKTISIVHEDLSNNLQVVSRRVYAINNETQILG